MAAPGFTSLQLYHTTAGGTVPLAANLAVGELAIDITDGKLYYKDNLGVVQLLTSRGTSVNLPGGGIGTVVFQSSTGNTSYLNLGTSGQVLVAGASAPQYVSQNTLSVGSALTATTATTATTTTNVAGGAPGSLVYQTGSGTTTTLSLGTAGNILVAGASAPQYINALPVVNGGTGATTAAAARNNLGATTLGSNIFTILNPGTITFPRFNADNTVSALNAADFRAAIGAGSASGSVTSVATSGSVNGLTLTGGPITSTGTITLGGSITSVSTSGNFQMNSLGVGTAGSSNAGEIRATNNITAYFSSDRKLKENIQDVNNALHKVCAIGSKTFDWTSEYIDSHGGEDGYFVQKSDFGVIAQDVQEVFPQAVRTRNDGTLAVDYEKLATLSFGAIKELVKRVEALESK